MSPGDIVKVRLQCQTESRQRGLQKPGPKYLGPVHCLLHIIREDGLRGLYRGALPLTLRDGPSYATYFLTYTTLYDWLSGSSKKKPREWRTSILLFSKDAPSSAANLKQTFQRIQTSKSSALVTAALTGRYGLYVGKPVRGTRVGHTKYEDCIVPHIIVF